MTISVALCTYNGENFIEQQLDSILNQTLKVDEIVVCDDISTDNTIKIIEEYSLKFPGIFKIYKNQYNLGSVKNFEKAISLCSGDIIFLSDQDDIWELNKVAVFESYFDKNQHINVLASNGYCITDENEILDKYTIWDVPQFFRDKNIAFDYFTMINFTANIATGASMAVRKNFIKNIFPVPEIEGYHHDEWIALHGSKTNSFEILNDKLFSYRIHENQQVGGVCHDKKDCTITNLIEIFNFSLKDNTIKSYKKLLKKICKSQKKNFKRIKTNPIGNQFLEDNLKIIEQKYYDVRKQMVTEKPIYGNITVFFDKIFNKRQLKK